MADACGIKHLNVYVQDNGIIRLACNGHYIGRTELTFNQLELMQSVPIKIQAEEENY